MALPLNLRQLADTTSFMVLLVFILVNLSLILIKRHAPPAEGVRVFPLWIPIVGLITSSGFVLIKLITFFTN